MVEDFRRGKWLELTNRQRAALNRASVAKSRTLTERWVDRPFAIPARIKPSERARVAASLLPTGCRSVLDIGCFSMRLEAYLPPSIRYVPLDVARRDHRTIVVDLNQEPLPDLGTDAAVALGVLEYLNDVPKLLRQIRCPAIVSYAPYDLMPDYDRESGGWKNSYTVGSFGALVEAIGFQIVARVPLPKNHMIWSLRPPG